MKLVLVNEAGEETPIDVDPTITSIYAVCNAYANKHNRQMDSFLFVHNGKTLPADSTRTVAELGIDEDNNVIKVDASLCLTVIDEEGEETRFKVRENTTPLSRVFTEYAKRKSTPLETLVFTRNGKAISVGSTASDLSMDEGNAAINVAVRQKMSIYFVNEDEGGDHDNGDMWGLEENPNLSVSRLFREYIHDKRLGLVWNRQTFKYKGKRLPIDCGKTLYELGMADGDIVYVSFQVPNREEVEEEFDSIQALASGNACHPGHFVSARVAQIFAHKNDANNTDEEIVETGIVVSYAEGEAGTIWTAKYPQGGEVEYSREDLISAILSFYDMDGPLRDIKDHFERVVGDLQSEVGFLKEGKIIRNPMIPLRVQGSTDELLLQGLKIEQDVERLLDISSQWQDDLRDTPAMQRLWTEFIDERKTLMQECRARSPMLEAGVPVYAKFWPDDIGDDPSWEYGAIDSFQCSEDTGYGPRREYCVTFDDGNLQENTPSDELMRENEYHLVKDYTPTKWKDVTRRFDRESLDPWAKNVGWFVVNIDGIEQPFTHLHDALRARDAHNGFKSDALSTFFEENVSESTSATQQRILLRLILASERTSNSDMKRICKNLSDSMSHLGPEINNRELAAGVSWKESMGHYEARNPFDMKDSVYRFSLAQQCVAEAMNYAQLCRFYIAARGNLKLFLKKVPLVREAHTAVSEGMEDMLTYLEKNAPENKDDFGFVNIVDADSSAKKKYTVPRSSPFKRILTAYAASKNTTVRSLRIEHNSRTVFLSSFGKQSPESLGLKDDDEIKVAIIQQSSPEPSPKAQRTKPKPLTSRGRGKKGKSKRKKRTQQPTLEPPVDDEEKMRAMWFDSISRVFAEADPQFRDIRQRLNALSLQRTKPKQRKAKPKKELEVETVDNPPTDGLGGKAGKSYFVVLVGEETNLYKTRKPSTSIAREIDLHGLTKEEALTKLDECLPKWVDTAMKEEYPWVIAVRIVCGGGSQTLAEAVEQWIRRNANVSNAPKSLYC